MKHVSSNSSVFANQVRIGDLIYHMKKFWLVEGVSLPDETANRRYNYRVSLLDPVEGKRIIKRGTLTVVAPERATVLTRK